MAKESQTSAITTVKSSNSKVIIIAIVIVVLAIASSFYFYTKYQSVSKNSSKSSSAEVQELINRVGKLIILPKNETPSVATVSDRAKLEDQAFFANAQNGDKVLIYSQAKKAILYRPSTNMIIDVAPVNLGANTATNPISSTTTPAASASSSPTPTVAVKSKSLTLLILNGTKTAGIATSAKTKISGKITDISTISTGDSVGNYAKTVIIDSSGNKTVDDQLVSLVGGTVSKTMPDGEKAAKQDIVIILGEDFNK
jgi:hypothetical protein